MITIVGAHLLSTLPACLTAASSDLSTQDISAEMVVEADGETTHVRTVLREGGAESHTYVRVDGSDQLSIDDGNRPLELKEESLGTYFYYTQDVTAQDAGTLFRFVFERSLDSGAPDSTVALPEPFEVATFEEDAVLSRTQEPLILSWEPASPSEPMGVYLSGACIEKAEVTVAPGESSVIFQPDALVSLEGTEQESCKLTATLTRAREGVPDARWHDGSTIQAEQVRVVSLTLDP